MISPYLLRLVCLCMASFFVVNVIGSVLISVASKALIAFSKKLRARSGSRLLFAAQLLPTALGLLLVFSLCIPSYLRLEPHTSLERIGGLCLLLALLGCAGWFISFARVSRALASNARFGRVRRRVENESTILGESTTATIVDSSQPILAIVGVFPPRLVVSRAILSTLSPEELRLALQHEKAHIAFRDNLKRLLLHLVPAPLFGRAFPMLKETWSRLSEWAADDEAIQGDPALAVSLAAALLRVARMGKAPQPAVVQTSFCADEQDLSARVDRLLKIPSQPEKADTWPYPLTIAWGIMTTLLAAVFLAWPVTLSSVHRLLELFLQ